MIDTLHQSDFVGGTYRITQPGLYRIMEDIVFDFKPPKDDGTSYNAHGIYFPDEDDNEEYPGFFFFGSCVLRFALFFYVFCGCDCWRLCIHVCSCVGNCCNYGSIFVFHRHVVGWM